MQISPHSPHLPAGNPAPPCLTPWGTYLSPWHKHARHDSRRGHATQIRGRLVPSREKTLLPCPHWPPALPCPLLLYLASSPLRLWALSSDGAVFVVQASGGPGRHLLPPGFAAPAVLGDRQFSSLQRVQASKVGLAGGRALHTKRRGGGGAGEG